MEPQLPEALQDLESDLGRLAHKKEAKGVALTNSVQSLQDSIDELLLMFKRANEELTLEQREEQLMKSQLDPVHKKLQELSEQQETIASAIVSVSEAIDTLTTSVNEIKARVSALDLTAPRMSNLPPMSPRPSYQRFDFPQSQAAQLPPPPPNPGIPSLHPNELGEKKGLF